MRTGMRLVVVSTLGWALACGLGGDTEEDVDPPLDEAIEDDAAAEVDDAVEEPVDEPEPEPPAIAELPDWDADLRVRPPSAHGADDADAGCTARAYLRSTEAQVKLRDAPDARSQPMGKIRPPFAGARLEITARTADFLEVASITPFDPAQSTRIIGRPSGWIDAHFAGATAVPCTDANGETIEPHLFAEPGPDAEPVTRLLPQPLQLVECEGGWWRVWAPRQGATGWLSDDHVCEDPDQSCRMSCAPPEE